MVGRPKGCAKTGGRKKGYIDKEKQECLAKAKELGVSPLEVMLEATKHYRDRGEWDKAGDMASKAAPYVHKKMPTETVLSGDPKKPVSLTIITTGGK